MDTTSNLGALGRVEAGDSNKWAAAAIAGAGKPYYISSNSDRSCCNCQGL